MFRLSSLTTGYLTPSGKKVIAEDINGQLNVGELTCLLGANGVGKSTLLKTLSGFLPIISGDISYHDESSGRTISLTDGTMDGRTRARLIAVVLTQRTNTQNMTVRDLVSMGRAPYTGFWGKLSEADEEIVSNALRDTGMEAFADRQVTQLSDGERQKVMIAKALAQQTPVIFLDEPTAFLDYPSKVEMMQLLLHLCHDHGKTVFLSTHDVEIAIQMADRIWLMESPARPAQRESSPTKSEQSEVRRSSLSIGTPQELAANGAIARFIERENVTFNPKDLTVKIEKFKN